MDNTLNAVLEAAKRKLEIYTATVIVALITTYLRGQRLPIIVHIGNESYTDHNKIVVGVTVEEVLAHSWSELIRIVKFKAYHEASHVRFTDKVAYDKICRKMTDMWTSEMTEEGKPFVYDDVYRLAHYVLNSVEDGRIENILVRLLPGLQKHRAWYRLGSWQEYDIQKDRSPLTEVLNNILDVATVGLYCKGFEGHYPIGTRVRDTVDSCIAPITEYVKSITVGAGESAALEIAKVIMPLVVEEYEYKPGKELPPELIEAIKKAIEEGEVNFGKGSRTPETAQDGPIIAVLTDEEMEDEESETPSRRPDYIIDLRKNPPKREKEDESSSGESSEGEPSGESEGQGEENSEEAEGNSSGSGEESEASEESEGLAGNGGESEENSSEDKSKESSSEGETGDESEGENSGDESTALSSKPEGEDGERREEKKVDAKTAFDSLQKNAAAFEKEVARGVEKALKNLERETAKAVASELDTLEREFEASERVQRENDTSLNAEDIADLSALGYSRLSGYKESRVDTSSIVRHQLLTGNDALQAEQTSSEIGNILASEKVDDMEDQFFGEELNVSSLGRFCCGEGDVWNTEGSDDAPESCCLILKDDSGSMGESLKGRRGSRSKEDQAIEALAFAEVSLKKHIPLKMITFTSSADGFRVIKDWEERDDSRCYALDFHRVHPHPMGGNDDATAIMVGAKQLLKRPEQKKLLIVISDGLPCCSKEAVHAAVAWARQNGVYVCSFFIGSKADVEANWEAYKEMYVRDFCGVNPATLGINLISFIRNFIDS